MQFQEVVEAQGHLIDSHIMEQIFDQVVEFGGRFEVEEFRVGRTNSEPSYLRLKVESTEQATMERLLQQLLGLGCSPVDSGDAQLRRVEGDRCAPDDFTPRPITAPWFVMGSNGSKWAASVWMRASS
jgi:hypothetical protein